MQKVWQWLKKFGLAVAGVLLFVMGAGWLWRRKQRELGQVKDALAVARAKSDIAQLREARKRVLEQVREDDVLVKEIDRRLAANERDIVEAHEGGEGLDDDEVADAFAKLGY